MDRVITDTAGVHYAAWKGVFDEYLSARVGDGDGDPAVELFRREDYLRQVDGKLV